MGFVANELTGMPVFHYTVDGEPLSTESHDLTAIDILKSAKIDPTKNYLVEIEGDHQVSYKDDPNKEIHMHENMTFVSVTLQGTVPLSC